MTRSERIRNLLKGRDLRGLCADSELDRQFLIGRIANLRGVSREEARSGVEIFAQRTQKEKGNPCISTSAQRRDIALYVTKQGEPEVALTPMNRLWSHVSERRYDRKFTPPAPSSGKGIRKFDGWSGVRIADARSKRKAKRVAAWLRKGGRSKVRVIEYQAGGKTAYSIYMKSPADIKSKTQIRYLFSRNSPLNDAMKGALRSEMEAGRVLVHKSKPSDLGIRMRQPGDSLNATGHLDGNFLPYQPTTNQQRRFIAQQTYSKRRSGV
jgi:hypothetical protein